MATDVTTRPQYLNANNLIYNFWDLRRYMDSDPPGPGVADYESFRVQPRQAGVNLSVDVGKTAVGLMQAWVRGSTRDGQGLYRIDNIDVTAPSANNFLAQLNVAVTSNASGNPRLDQVVLVIADAQHAGGVSKAYIDVIAGTPTAAATLDNRLGFAALPASCILLADILLASGDATVDAVDIRDRRFFPLVGTAPPVLTAVDMVSFQPCPGIPSGIAGLTAGTYDTQQAACLMYLPRRIALATRIRWKYSQLATAAASNYVIAIFDSTGRLIVSTAATAFAGAGNSSTEASLAITPNTFEPGNYYVFFGTAAITASSGPIWWAVIPNLNTTVAPGVTARAQAFKGTGSTTVPTTLLGLTDAASFTANAVIAPVPIITLSVG